MVYDFRLLPWQQEIHNVSAAQQIAPESGTGDRSSVLGWLGIAMATLGALLANSDEFVQLFQLKPSSDSEGFRPLVPVGSVQFE